MKKVMILANNDIGLYHFRGELLAELLNVPYEVHIALPYGKFVEDMQQMGCIYYETKMERRGTNPVQELGLIKTYKKVLKEVKPDVVLTYTIKPNIYGGSACASLGIPYITNITGLGTALEGNGLLAKVLIRMYRHAMRKVHTLFFQNEVNRHFFEVHRIGTQNKELIPGSGVNLERFQSLPYPEGDPVEFLFISRVMKEKGIDQFLDCAKAIRAKYPNTKFRILGFCEDDDSKPDSYAHQIQKLVEEGIVSFEGMVDDVSQFLRNAQCTIHPSYYPEGMSNVCLESAACARPVITTLHTGCQETVEDGRTGFLVETENSEAVIAAVERFLKLSVAERRQMGLAAREKMEQEFDRQIVVKTYMDAIMEIVK